MCHHAHAPLFGKKVTNLPGPEKKKKRVTTRTQSSCQASPKLIGIAACVPSRNLVSSPQCCRANRCHHIAASGYTPQESMFYRLLTVYKQGGTERNTCTGKTSQRPGIAPSHTVAVTSVPSRNSYFLHVPATTCVSHLANPHYFHVPAIWVPRAFGPQGWRVPHTLFSPSFL